MKKSTSMYPRVSHSATGTGLVSHAGTALLLRAAEKTGLTSALSSALAPWRRPSATHDPGKILLDLVVAVAAGGDCLADIDQLRGHPELFGQVASDPTVSRLIGTLATDPKAAAAINQARRASRAAAWGAAGDLAPDDRCTGTDPLVIDLDATLVTAHSEKRASRTNLQAGLRFSPIMRVRRPRPGRDR